MVVKDHAVSKESFIICECQNCHLWFTNPRPDKENIQKYYQSVNYISHQNKANSIINFVYKIVRNFTIKQKIKWLNEKVNKKGRILDFGCGTGHFLKAAKKNGWDSYGIEPDLYAASYAKTKNKINLINGLVELNNIKKFDAITLFHVLEHVHDLNKNLSVLIDRLKKRGTLFIALPNRDSKDSKEFKENWASLDVPRHLYHFNQPVMDFLADKFNCRIVDIKPMIFDSYYITILSNKYSNSNASLWASTKQGFLSNQFAKEHDNNFSSLLYILKKK
ncbi:MAG: class I SAM-dependent methyltransferase [Cyclobacteriaceae bacterium]